jgi:hypothetical protein
MKPQNPPTFNIVSYTVKRETLATNLSKVQKLVCRLFKIVPEKYFDYELVVHPETVSGCKVSDILLSIDGNQWLVTSVDDDKTISISSIIPIKNFCVAFKMMVISRQYAG